MSDRLGANRRRNPHPAPVQARWQDEADAISDVRSNLPVDTIGALAALDEHTIGAQPDTLTEGTR